MAQQRLVTGALNRAFRNPGTFSTNDYPVPVGVLGVVLELERDGWPVRVGVGATPAEIIRDSEVVRIIIEMSFDGGATWRTIARAGSPGGDIMIPDPNNESQQIPAPFFSLTVPFPEPSNAARRARATMEVRERLRTQVHIDVLT